MLWWQNVGYRFRRGGADPLRPHCQGVRRL
jgi:hypothetical protein